MKRIVLVTAALLAGCGPALAYGGEGHQAVAELARQQLTPSTKKTVIAILGNDDLAAIATWPDQLKTFQRAKTTEKKRDVFPKPADFAEATTFNRTWKRNGKWHFVNLPLGNKTYPSDLETKHDFTSPSDIVHKIGNCVQLLQVRHDGHNRDSFTQRQALSFLVHLVGDIHQPMHVGTGYYDIDGEGRPHLKTDPKKVFDENGRLLPDDVGGNILFFKDKPSHELHAYWDTDLVSVIRKESNRSGYKGVAAALTKDFNFNAVPQAWRDMDSSSDLRQWPVRWATDSLFQANKVFQGLTVESATLNEHNEPESIIVSRTSTYEKDQLPLARQQMRKAAFHLADLLNHIQWP